MLNPLVAAQQQLYTIQQNIDNAFNENYHRRTTSTESTQFSNYVNLNTSRSGDFMQDMQLHNANSQYQSSKEAASNLSSLSTWLDSWQNGKPSVDINNNTPDTTSTMSWFNTGVSEAESFRTTSLSSLDSTLSNVNSILKELAGTNQASLNGQSTDNLKDIQTQLLSDLSSHLSVSARYDGEQLSVSLPSGEPLVLGTTSSTLSRTTVGLNLNFQHANFNLSGDRLPGAVATQYKNATNWDDAVNVLAAARDDFALKVNAWNASNGALPAYTVNSGSLVAGSFNNGSISVNISQYGSISDLGTTARTNTTGTKSNDTSDFTVVSALKIENDAGVFKIYTKSTTNNNWSLQSSDVDLATAANQFNTKGNMSVALGGATVTAASLPGDTWIWSANNSTVSVSGQPSGAINIGMSRTDMTNNNATLGFTGTDSDYTPTPALNLSIGAGNTLNGFPNGSIVRVQHTDGSFTDTTVAGGTGPVWENGATYKYNGIKWAASGDAVTGNTWLINPPTKLNSGSATKLGELKPDSLGNYRTYVGISAKSANTKVTVDQAYYTNVKDSWQAQNGVNLDEEAQNLTKTRQWYEALVKSESIKTSLWQTFMDSI